MSIWWKTFIDRLYILNINYSLQCLIYFTDLCFMNMITLSTKLLACSGTSKNLAWGCWWVQFTAYFTLSFCTRSNRILVFYRSCAHFFILFHQHPEFRGLICKRDLMHIFCALFADQRLQKPPKQSFTYLGGRSSRREALWSLTSIYTGRTRPYRCPFGMSVASPR
jgi:hypothetical protein